VSTCKLEFADTRLLTTGLLGIKIWRLVKKFPFTKLQDMDVNTIIFPNLSSGNIAYKMMQEIGGAEVIGPILLGIGKPVHILQLESSVREIVNMATIAVVDAQCYEDGNYQ